MSFFVTNVIRRIAIRKKQRTLKPKQWFFHTFFHLQKSLFLTRKTHHNRDVYFLSWFSGLLCFCLFIYLVNTHWIDCCFLFIYQKVLSCSTWHNLTSFHRNKVIFKSNCLKVHFFSFENNVFEATDFQSILMGEIFIIDLPNFSLNSKIGSQIRKKKN